MYLAASGDTTPAEVDTLASAFDKALGGDGGQVAVGTPDAASPDGASPDAPSDSGAPPSDEAGASESPAAPALEAAIPDAVGDITLGKDSATGADVLGDDPGARAVAAALRAAGHEPSDLLVAYASDEAGAADLTITGLAVDGMGQKALADLATSAWLPAGGAGVTKIDGDRRGPRGHPGGLRRRRTDRLRALDPRGRVHRHHGRRGPRGGGAAGPALIARGVHVATAPNWPLPHGTAPAYAPANVTPGTLRGGRSERDDVREQLVAWAEDCRVQGEVDLDGGRLSDAVNDLDIIMFHAATLVALEDGHIVREPEVEVARRELSLIEVHGPARRSRAAAPDRAGARAPRGRAVHGHRRPASIAEPAAAERAHPVVEVRAGHRRAGGDRPRRVPAHHDVVLVNRDRIRAYHELFDAGPAWVQQPVVEGAELPADVTAEPPPSVSPAS